MDPVTCYEEMMTYLSFGEREEMGDRAQSLVSWLESGGFCPPALVTRFGETWRILSYLSDILAVCRMA